MSSQRPKLIITSPHLDLSGGVVSFVKSLKGCWCSQEVYVFRGGHKGNLLKKGFKSFRDIFKFLFVLVSNPNSKLLINTSLNKNAYRRDLVYCYLSNLYSKEVYLFIHGWDKDYFKKIKIDFRKSAFFKSKKIFVLSKDFKNDLIETGYPEENVIVERTVVEKSFAENFVGDNKDFNTGKFNILFLSRIEEEKGIFTLLTAFKELHKINSNFTLCIAGMGSKAQEVKEFIASNTELPIYYQGRVEGEKKIRLFKQAQFYVLPTRHPEGLPISLLEAITAGCVPFLTTPGGIKYFFKDKEMGFVLKNATKQELIKKILSSVDDLNLVKKISDKNFEKGRLEFSPKSLIQRMELVMYG